MMDQDNTAINETVPMVEPIASPLAPETTNEQPGIEQENPVKKKKCRGQRKKQRYRRQLYARGLDTLSVDKLVEEEFSSQLHPQEQQPDDTEIAKNQTR